MKLITSHLVRRKRLHSITLYTLAVHYKCKTAATCTWSIVLQNNDSSLCVIVILMLIACWTFQVV